MWALVLVLVPVPEEDDMTEVEEVEPAERCDEPSVVLVLEFKPELVLVLAVVAVTS